MREKLRDLCHAHFLRVSQVIETDEALYLIAIRPFRPKTVMLQPQYITRLIEKLSGTAGGADARVMSSLLVTGLAKGNRIVQILSAINCRFLGPNSS
jgi:hypothetical protein